MDYLRMAMRRTMLHFTDWCWILPAWLYRPIINWNTQHMTQAERIYALRRIMHQMQTLPDWTPEMYSAFRLACDELRAIGEDGLISPFDSIDPSQK